MLAPLRIALAASAIASLAVVTGCGAAPDAEGTGTTEQAMTPVGSSGGSSGGGGADVCDGNMPADPASCFTDPPCSLPPAGAKAADGVQQDAGLQACTLGTYEVVSTPGSGLIRYTLAYVCPGGTAVPAGSGYSASTTYCDFHIGAPLPGLVTMVKHWENSPVGCPGGCPRL
jgi:hypothetical protein